MPPVREAALLKTFSKPGRAPIFEVELLDEDPTPSFNSAYNAERPADRHRRAINLAEEQHDEGANIESMPLPPVESLLEPNFPPGR
jgi:hypothetical protein